MTLSSHNPTGHKPTGTTPDVPMKIETLVAEHAQAAYAYGFRLSGNAVDAEDLAQQAFLLAQINLHQLKDPTRSRSWLLQIVRNCFLREIKQKKRTFLETDIDLLISEEVTRNPVATEIDDEKIRIALDELPDDYRVVLLMFYFEDASYKQIASELELPIGTVMSRLARAKSHLRHKVADGLVTKE